MMENEVIIDGCNVAECMYYDYEDCSASAVFDTYGELINCQECKEIEDCYFKQLQCVKAKNEKLKSLINMHLTTFDECCANGLIMSNNMSEVLNLKATDKMEFKQYYKAENERLKDNLSDAEAIILTYQTELKELYKSNDKLQAENEKLKKEIMLIRQGYDEESCIETCPEVQVLRKELDNFRRID